MKSKAIGFLWASVGLSLLLAWLRVEPPYNGASSNNILFVLQLLIIIAYHLVLAIITARDIRKFWQSEIIPAIVSNWAIVSFILFPFILANIVWLGGNYVAKDTKYCGLPRLQDLFYDNRINTRSGAQSMLLNHYDAGCNILWVAERENPSPVEAQVPPPTDAASYLLTGNENRVPSSLVIIFQYVKIFAKPVTPIMIDTEIGKLNGDPFAIRFSGEVIRADFFQYSCVQSEIYKECRIGLGYENTLVSLRVMGYGVSSEALQKLITNIVSNVDNHVSKYPISLP